jgi:hypothetical protein
LILEDALGPYHFAGILKYKYPPVRILFLGL